jgi:hypothetical protein
MDLGSGALVVLYGEFPMTSPWFGTAMKNLRLRYLRRDSGGTWIQDRLLVRR